MPIECHRLFVHPSARSRLVHRIDDFSRSHTRNAETLTIKGYFCTIYVFTLGMYSRCPRAIKIDTFLNRTIPPLITRRIAPADGLSEALHNIAEWRAVGRQQSIIRNLGEKQTRRGGRAEEIGRGGCPRRWREKQSGRGEVEEEGNFVLNRISNSNLQGGH